MSTTARRNIERELRGRAVAALARAMQYIQRGWTQGAYSRTRQGVACMPDSPEVWRVDLAWALQHGAIEHRVTEARLRRAVLDQLGEPYARDEDFGLERWNDKAGRTRTEVIIVLERTAAEL